MAILNVGQSRRVEATQPQNVQLQETQAAMQLKVGSVYIGMVDATYPASKTCRVRIGDNVITNVQYAIGIIGSSLLGVNTISLPTPGTTVLVLYNGSFNFILCVLPQLVIKNKENFFGSIGGDLKFMTAGSQAFCSPAPSKGVNTTNGVRPSSDLLPGELELTSGTGTLLHLLYNMAQISSGGLARIEVAMLNDMVRVVDNYFNHQSCGGEHLIWSNGTCNSQEMFTSYQSEADGITEDNNKYVDLESGVPDLKDISDPYNDTGRWRLKIFKGYLADILHIMVNDPIKAISDYDKGGTALGGKARMWIGTNGMVMVQSCSAIHMEVTPKVVIPTQKYQWNHPDLKDVDKQMETINNEFLNVWGDGQNTSDLKVACWQMQSYVKYITLWQSLARFKQSQEMFKVPTENEAKDPRPDCDDKRPGGDKGAEGYGSVTIDSSGSITLCANGTTTVTLNQGNVQIACPGNFEVKAGGTVSLSGTNVVGSATKKMELSSLGGLWIRSRNWFYALCEKGRMWFKSDAQRTDDASEQNPDLEEIDEPSCGKFGILIDATNAGVMVQGETGMVLSVNKGIAANAENSEDGEEEDDSVSDGDLILQHKGGNGAVSIASNKEVKVFAKANFKLKTANFLSSAQTFLVNSWRFIVNKNFVILGGNLYTDRMIVAKNIINRTCASIDEESFNKTITPLLNETTDDLIKQIQEMKLNSFIYDLSENELDKFKWTFGAWDSYTGAADEYNSLKMPLYELNSNWVKKQHSIKIKPTKISQFKISSTQKRNNEESVSWPGEDAQIWKYDSGGIKALGDPWGEQYTEEHIGGLAKMQQDDYAIYTITDEDDDEAEDDDTGGFSTGEDADDE